MRKLLAANRRMEQLFGTIKDVCEWEGDRLLSHYTSMKYTGPNSKVYNILLDEKDNTVSVIMVSYVWNDLPEYIYYNRRQWII
jgi:hypothetical protein